MSTRKRRHSEPKQNVPVQVMPKLFSTVKKSMLWEKVLTIWLSDRALQELDRRNAPDPSSSQPRKRRRLVTRTFLQGQPVSTQSLQATDLARIEALSKHGGPNLSDLRGYRKATSDRCSTPPPMREFHDGNFGQYLERNNILPVNHQFPDGSETPKPRNFEEIRERISQSRSSPSAPRTSDTGFEDFIEAMLGGVEIEIIEGPIPDSEHRTRNNFFAKLAPITPEKFDVGSPFICYGSRPGDIKQHVREQLVHHIDPTPVGRQHPLASNFFVYQRFGKWSPAGILRKVQHDAALGARAIHSLRTYGRKDDIDGNAYMIAAIYHDGVLRLFTSHLATPSSIHLSDSPTYCMTQLKEIRLTDSETTFWEGVDAFRNARDWAREQREEAIRMANERSDEISAA